MAETSFPTEGGGSVTDATYEKLMAEVTGSGMLGSTSQSPLMYADSTGRQIKLAANRAAIVRAFRWESDASGLVRALAANTSGQPRLDLGVLRLNRADFSVRFDILQGSPAANPIAPIPTQQEGPSGVWELPVGTVKVTSSAVSGQPSIASTDVTPLEWYLAPQPILAHSTQMPAIKPGLIVHQYNTGKTLIGVGSTWQLVAETGPRAALAASTGWSSSSYVQRRNGFVHAYLHFGRSGSAIPAGSAGGVAAVLPDQFRPNDPQSIYFSHIVGGTYPARGYITAATGEVFLEAVPNVGYGTGNSVVIGALMWPAKA